jgi:hypothetical protein
MILNTKKELWDEMTSTCLCSCRLQNNFSFEAMEKEEAIACAPKKAPHRAEQRD